ncbi:MAG: PAS domain S-box protein [Proteobacteria bacterium]|nr:PAS domain S-box protein [Pseudomonadota bacterium]
MKYRYRFLFLFFLVCLCGYLFFAFYEEAKKTAIQELNARQMLHAQHAANDIEEFFARWIDRLTYLSEDEAIITLNDAGKKEMAIFLYAHKDRIKGVTRVDVRGRITYTVPYVKKSIGADISYQKHIREIMRTHKPVVSDVFSAVQGFDSVALHVPVFRGNRYDGSIAILINFQALAKRYLEDIRIGKTGYAWVISREGIELYCPVPGHMGKSVFENCKDFPTIITMTREMLKGNQGVTTYLFDMIMGQSVQTVKKHAVYMPIRMGNTFWSIVVASSEDEVLASLKDFRNRLLIIIGMLILSGTIFSYYGMKAWGIVQEEKGRRIVEGELRESERRLADIINFLPDATLAIDREGRIITWNKAIEEMTGFPAETMLGKGDYEYAIPFYGTRRPILINFVTTWDQNIEKQYAFIKKEGDTLFTETNVPCVRGLNRILWAKAGPLYDTHGNVVGAIESIRDITERKQAEEALFNEKEKLLILSENAPFGMALIDKNGQFLYINPKYRDIFGYDLNDIPDGKTWFKKAYPDAAYRRGVISTWLDDLNSASSGEQRPRVFDVTCKGGSTKVISFIPVLLGNGDNMMVCEDITERKRLETQLMNAQKMEAIGTLSGGIAHDFNNILMGIQGYASLMMLDINAEHPHYERLKRIEEQVKSAADLTRQLLGFARGGKYVVKPVNMNELIEKTSTMFGRTKKEVAIHRKYEKDIWVVEADQGQIEQVLLNLYLNAWQAMPAGGDLSLETKNIIVGEDYVKPYSMMPGRYVRIYVSDAGVGMDEKTKEKIFEPFFTTKELGRGTGLGLAMVYGIIKNHNGFIDVISELGKGTTFVLCFPASEKDVVKEKPAAPEIMRGTETILLVDDEPDVLAVSKAILESLGYSVYGVKNGEETITLYKEKKDGIDLIILDMIMPGLSGGETFDRIRELNPSARIILSSGYSLNDQAQQIMNKGCHGFIQKPFDIIQLSRKICEVLI